MVKNPPAIEELQFGPWVRKRPCRREWLTTPVFLPGEFHGLYSTCGPRESDMTEKLSLSHVHLRQKLSSGHRTGKGKFSFQSQRKAVPKNTQTTTQLHSSHTLVIMLKILQARLQQYMNCELPNVER